MVKQVELDLVNYDQVLTDQNTCECCGAQLTDDEKFKYESVCNRCMYEQTMGLSEYDDSDADPNELWFEE